MIERMRALGVIAATAGLAACSGTDESAAPVFTYADGSPHAMTEWGDPDLQGMWPIMHIFTTPLQRPLPTGRGGPLPTERVRSDEEVARAQAAMDQRNANYHRMVETNTLGMGGWAESTTTVSAIGLNWLISYPPDGRFPALTARGEELRPLFKSDDTQPMVFDSPTGDFDQWDRCITRGLPNSMLPINYNNGVSILQSPGYVVINTEMIHESRIVPIDREPLDPAIKQWMGESRGHWEGSTLVIETTNFNGEVNMTNVGIPGSPPGDTPSTTGMRTVERLTRVADNRIDYEMTVEDPEVLTDKFTFGYPMMLDETYQFYEYACHEDNTAVRNFIETSRYERAHPEEFAQPAGGPGGFGGGRGGPPGGGAPARGAGAGQ
jgi:hypothetical protein